MEIVMQYQIYMKSNGTGGLFGNCWNATMKDLMVEGEINSTAGAGGIACNARTCDFINCINKANITGAKSIGGIAGYTYDGWTKFINCANYGTLVGGQFNAGILGWDWANSSKIYNCFNAGVASAATIKSIYSGETIEMVNTFNYGKCSTVVAGNIGKVVNCFYLLGSVNSVGNTSIVEYDENKMKSEEFIEELNTFIESGAKDYEVDTTGWAKWMQGEDGYPTLDLKNSWNGTNWTY